MFSSELLPAASQSLPARCGYPAMQNARYTPRTAAPVKRDIKIARATHLMHLEGMRYALYRESISFLLGGDRALATRRAEAALRRRHRIRKTNRENNGRASDVCGYL
jgi:hypothetical protein